jgi:corrinoid protein of di/trimethylamine methyltransferase
MASEAGVNAPLLGEIREALRRFDSAAVAELVASSVSQGIDPLATIQVLTEVITDVGARFGAGELWLPELLSAAKAMSGAMPILQGEITRRGGQVSSQGKIVLGTVYGDVHSIGIDIVATLLAANGFEVHHLGVNVPADTFLEAVRTHNPHILGMSALLTTTAPEQRKVVRRLKEEGLRDSVRVMVGGGAITQRFADEIGADGYAPNAPAAVELAASLIHR